MNSDELRKKFIQFFEGKGHIEKSPASLMPSETDSSVLFTTAGMQQFKRFYTHLEEAPASRIVTIQPCVRTSDIEEVGDETHLTFFEMLGNFGFGYDESAPRSPERQSRGEGGYFKEDAIRWAWEFLTDKKWLGIESGRISAAYFDGGENLPSDKESLDVLKKLDGLKKIKSAGFEDNFWSLGVEGSPGGPTVEFYIDGIEVWNLVFNECILKNGKYKSSKYKGVDTGMGLERLAAVMQGKKDVFETDLFLPIIEKIRDISGKKYSGESYEIDKENIRIIADHIKSAVFTIANGILPSNKEQGYVVRRLIRRAIVKMQRLGFFSNFTAQLAEAISKVYQNTEFNLESHKNHILLVLDEEETKFRKTLDKGQKMFDRLKSLSGKELFDLYQTYGFPLELSLELAKEKRVLVRESAKREFEKEFEKHQELSRAGIGTFKGGLADQSKETIKLHTAAHLLLTALRKVLGTHVVQKGSNINPERLRFDFSHPEKMTEEQIKKVENMVNEQIRNNLPVKMKEMCLKEAKKSGALGVFDERYGEKVKVYTIGPSPSAQDKLSFSREICGGPHVNSTGELGHFKITNEQSSSAGVRRIKARVY